MLCAVAPHMSTEFAFRAPKSYSVKTTSADLVTAWTSHMLMDVYIVVTFLDADSGSVVLRVSIVVAPDFTPSEYCKRFSSPYTWFPQWIVEPPRPAAQTFLLYFQTSWKMRSQSTISLPRRSLVPTSFLHWFFYNKYGVVVISISQHTEQYCRVLGQIS